MFDPSNGNNALQIHGAIEGCTVRAKFGATIMINAQFSSNLAMSNNLGGFYADQLTLIQNEAVGWPCRQLPQIRPLRIDLPGGV